jgi:hypothetical protein
VHPLNKFFDFETGLEYSSFPTSGYFITESYDSSSSANQKTKYTDMNLIDYFGKSEPLFRQSEPPAKVGWICM